MGIVNGPGNLGISRQTTAETRHLRLPPAPDATRMEYSLGTAVLGRRCAVGLGMQKGLRETDPRRPLFPRDASDDASDIALSFFVASIHTLLTKGDTLRREATNNVVFALSLQSPLSQEA